ncbi:MAG TPA: hypothetical protein VHB21_23075 [Minicystis sp.]|nr:hypothetical protein [Minicystis sp.]
MRVGRYVGWVFGAIFGGFGLFMLTLAVLGLGKKPDLLWAPGAVFALVGLSLIGAIEFQVSRLRAARRAVHATVAAVAERLFDTPARVTDGYDGSALMGPFGAWSTSFDGANFTAAEGTSKGAKLLVASHPSVVGRQMFELYHVYSYVIVDVPGVWTTFMLTEQDGATKLFSKLGGGRDVEVGDAAFDQAFIVDADPDVAARVLDPSIRERLMRLRGQVASVSQDWGAGRMSVGLGARGLGIRWPGELSVAFAEALRDLLLDMRARLLAAPGAAAVGQR